MVLAGFGLLVDLGLILFFATLLNFIAKYFNQPSILAFIIAGILIGPFGLGSLGIEINGVELGITNNEQIAVLSELGIAFLLFYVGIDSNVSKIRELGKVAVVGTTLQVLITIAFVVIANALLGVLSFQQALYLGAIMSFSSTAIVVKILTDARKINTLESRLMLGFLLVQDFLAVLAISFLGSLESLESLSSFGFIFTLLLKIFSLMAIAYLLNRLLYEKMFFFASKSEELFFLLVTSLVFLFIFICYFFDLPISIGAFIAGISISSLSYTPEVLGKIRSLRDFFGTVFFVTLGIQVTPSFMSFSLELAVFVLLVLLIIKPLSYFLTGISFGYGGRTSLLVALGLAQISEFSFIVASQGKHVLDQTQGLYSFIILVIAFSMALTPYSMKYSDKVYGLFAEHLGSLVRIVRKVKYFYRKMSSLSNVSKSYSNHIVVFGAGTIGNGIVNAFKESYEMIAIDNDPEVAGRLIKNKVNFIYGSFENPEVWERASLEKAKVIAIAAPFNAYSIPLIKKVKEKNKQCIIFARCHYFSDALALYDAGADFVIMPQVAGANLFIKKIGEYLEKGKVYEVSNYQSVFMDYLKEKAREEKEWL